MSAFFVGANTQYLINSSPPITNYPFSVGMWINLAALGTVTRVLWALSDTGSTNNYFLIRVTANENISMAARSGSSESVGTTAMSLVAGKWTFIIARFIASDNRKLYALTDFGMYGGGTSTTARSPTGIDTMTMGVLSTSGGITEPWDGAIAEYWLAKGDVYPDPASHVDLSYLYMLAYNGPFMLPFVASNIVEYHSLRCGPDMSSDNVDDSYFGSSEPQKWVNTNGVSTWTHCVLPYWYRKPSDVSVMAMI